MYYEINTCRMKNLVNVIPKKNPVVTPVHAPVDRDRIDDKRIATTMPFLPWDRGVGGLHTGLAPWIIFSYALKYLLFFSPFFFPFSTALVLELILSGSKIWKIPYFYLFICMNLEVHAENI